MREAERPSEPVAGVPERQRPASQFAERPGQQRVGRDHMREYDVDAAGRHQAQQMPAEPQDDPETRATFGISQRDHGDVGGQLGRADAGGEHGEVLAAGGDRGRPIVGDPHVGTGRVELLGDHQDPHAVRLRSCSSARRR